VPETTAPADQTCLEVLRRKPQSARGVAETLGRNTDRSTVASIRHTLERMERQGLVQRSLPVFQGAWIWEVVTTDAS
jgi:predicted transcriptional regulator